MSIDVSPVKYSDSDTLIQGNLPRSGIHGRTLPQGCKIPIGETHL